MTDSDQMSQAFPSESEDDPLPSPETSTPDADQRSQAIPPVSDDDPRVQRLLAAYAPGLIEHLRAHLDDLWSGDLAVQVAPAIRAEADANRSLDVVTPEPPLALRRSVSERATIFCLQTGLTRPALVLLLEYAPRIKSALKRSKYGPYLSAEDLEDLAQDTIVRAVERGAQYRPELSGLGSWLNMLAGFAMLDLIRERSALSQAGRERLAAEQLRELGEGTPEFDEQMRARLQQAVRALSPGLALYIQRHFFEGWSDAEIQHRMNVKAGTLRVWKKRALDKLRAILDSSLGLVLVLLIATVGPVVAHPSFEAPGVGAVAQAPGLTPSTTPAPVLAEAPPPPIATATAAPLPATPTPPPLAAEPDSPTSSPVPTEALATPSATATPAASLTPLATATLPTLPSPTIAPPRSERPLPPTATARPELQLSITPIRAPAPVLEEIPAAPTAAAEPTAAPEPEMTATASATPSPTATATASATPLPTATATASVTPTPEVCQEEAAAISGAEMGYRAEQTIVIPESRWSTVQVVGRFADRACTVPELVRFRFADGTEVVRHTPARVNDSGYVFEAPGRPGLVSVYVREARGAATARAIVITTGSVANEGVCGVLSTPLAEVYNGAVAIDVPLPTALAQPGALRVRGAFFATTQDRPALIFGAEAGGVVIHTQTGPDAGPTLFIEEVTLANVPAGTDRVRIWFASPHSDNNTGIFVSASVAYPCPPASPLAPASPTGAEGATLAGPIRLFYVMRRRRASHNTCMRCPRPVASEAGNSPFPPGQAHSMPRGA